MLRQKQSSGTETHNFIEMLTGNLLNTKIDNSTLVVSIYGVIHQKASSLLSYMAGC